jgi:hypothetical protein
MYLRHDGRAIPIAVRGTIPSAERALGDRETAGIAGWTDTAADRAWLSVDPSRVLRSIDRFHAIPDVPARAGSWAEWLYFNGTANGTRFYLTFMSGPERSPGQRAAGVRLQLERDGRLTPYSAEATVPSADLIAGAPDVTFGSNRVRLAGTDYEITLDLPAEHGGGRVTGRIVVHATPDRAVPPFILQGAGGWISGYTVPVMAGGLDGELRADGAAIDLSGGSAYHDHNWGFWEGVSWQWGQVQHDGLSFVYGRVRPPADAADPAHIPGFLGVLGPNGPLAFSTDATIEESDETDAGGRPQPRQIVVRASGDGFAATLRLDIGQTTITRGSEGRSLGGGLDFLQMRASYRVDGHIGDRAIAFTAPGSAETFRGAASPAPAPARQ